jgi:hypothetical protein
MERESGCGVMNIEYALKYAPAYLFIGNKQTAVLFGDERMNVKKWTDVYRLVYGRVNQDTQAHEDFNEQYALAFTPTTETRYADPTDANEDGDCEPYDRRVMTVTVTARSFSDVAASHLSGDGLPYGAYVAEEERAPANYSLLPQHTSYSFWLLPGNVVIKLNQDESTVYVDDIQVSVHEAMNAAIAGIQNYDDAEGLAAELQGILDTLLSQLKVDAVFTVEAGQSVNSQLITFENYPFGKIEVNKYDMVTELPLAGAHFRIQGYFAEGNANGMPIDRVGITGADGKLVFDNLPAGQYTISEIEAPDGYELSKPSFRSISLTWGQTASTAFYNKPKVLAPQVYVTVNKNLPNGYEFANKCDAGGKYNGEFVIGGSTWVTKIYAQPQKLPRTGY